MLKLRLESGTTSRFERVLRTRTEPLIKPPGWTRGSRKWFMAFIKGSQLNSRGLICSGKRARIQKHDIPSPAAGARIRLTCSNMYNYTDDICSSISEVIRACDEVGLLETPLCNLVVSSGEVPLCQSV